MMLHYALAVFLLAGSLSAKSVLNSRNIQRIGNARDVNLVEFVIRDVLHGKCAYTDRTGRDVSLIYEESAGELKARSLNKFVIDVDASVRECRALATEVPKTESLEGRSGVPGKDESPLELRARFNKYARANVENRQYVDQLQPRFLTWLGSLGTNIGLAAAGSGTNPGLSFGQDSTDQSNLPGINLFSSNNQNAPYATTLGSNPFDFLNNDPAQGGPWSVLNSISQNGGFGGSLFGLNGIFGRRR